MSSPSTVRLGVFESQRQSSPSLDITPVLAALRDQIISEVQDSIAEKVVAMFGEQMRGIVARMGNPTINVAAPNISMPAMEMPTPEVMVNVTPNMSMPGMDEMCAMLTTTNTLLSNLITLLSKPVTKEVHRDSYQNIDRVIETR